MEDKEQGQKHSTRMAIIGLVGTILTVCGGLAGALIGGLTTIYKVEQDVQHLAIAAPQSAQSLAVDTRQIAISSSKVVSLEPSKNLVFQDLGFVMAQPLPGWNQGKQMTFSDLFLEHGADLSPLVLFYGRVKDAWNDQPLREIRYSEPVMVQFVEGSTENGIAVDPTKLENATIAFYSRFIVLALNKAITQKDFSLYDLALAWGNMHQGGVNHLVANPDSQYIFEQVSWGLKGVRVENRKVDLTLQRWALFAEGPDRYYVIEVQYVPAANQSTQVWDDMQIYMDAFRVIH